jgi:hypothetical protein
MKYIKKFEIRFDLDVEEIYLEDIYKKSKYRFLYSNMYRHKDHKIVKDILEEKLKGKIISFTHRETTNTYVHTQLKKDKILDVEYDNDGGNRISYVKTKDSWYSIYEEEPIYIHNTESDADKYNL